MALPILSPILFAVVLSLLFSPVYSWLRQHRIPTPLALVLMLAGLTVLFGGIFLLLGVSIARFSGDMGSYTGRLNGQVDNFRSLAKSLGTLESRYPRGRGATQRPDRGYQRSVLVAASPTSSATSSSSC